jgi:hypothetical protein
MRQRFNRFSLCSHTTPDGKSYQGEQAKLHKKFCNGTITRDELKSYCLMMHSSKPTAKEAGFRTIKVWNKEVKVTLEEYNTYCATLNL